MSENNWQTATDPSSLFALVAESVDRQKLRLFACACCRRIWHLMRDPRCRDAVLIAERYANGLASDSELQSAATLALSAASADGDNGQEADAAAAASSLDLNFVAAANSAAWAAADAIGNAANVRQSEYGEFTNREYQKERQIQAELFREIVGNPTGKS